MDEQRACQGRTPLRTDRGSTIISDAAVSQRDQQRRFEEPGSSSNLDNTGSGLHVRAYPLCRYGVFRSGRKPGPRGLRSAGLQSLAQACSKALA
jgi:hypothetical protein